MKNSSRDNYEKRYKEIIYELYHGRALSNSQRAKGLADYAKRLMLIIKQQHGSHQVNESGQLRKINEFEELETAISYLVKETTIVHYKLNIALKQKTTFHFMRKILTDRLFLSSIIFLVGVGILLKDVDFLALFDGWGITIIGAVCVGLGIAGFIYDVYSNNRHNRKIEKKNNNGKEEDFYL